MRKLSLLLLLLFTSFTTLADPSPIFKAEAKAPVEQVYDAVYASLEEARFWVVFEANIGANLERMEERLGDSYNTNKLEAIRSMVVCNAWYANKVANADPDLLALCPLRVSVIHKEGISSVLFVRPSVAAANSPGLPLIQEIEDIIVKAINQAVQTMK